MESVFLVLLVFVAFGLLLWVYNSLQGYSTLEPDLAYVDDGTEAFQLASSESTRRDWERRQVDADRRRGGRHWSGYDRRRRWRPEWSQPYWYQSYTPNLWYNPLTWFPWTRDYNTCRDLATRQCASSLYPQQCVGNYYELCRQGAI